MSTSGEAKTHRRSWPIFRFLFSRITLLIIFLLIQIFILWGAFEFLNDTLAYGFFIFFSVL